MKNDVSAAPTRLQPRSTEAESSLRPIKLDLLVMNEGELSYERRRTSFDAQMAALRLLRYWL